MKIVRPQLSPRRHPDPALIPLRRRISVEGHLLELRPSLFRRLPDEILFIQVMVNATLETRLRAGGVVVAAARVEVVGVELLERLAEAADAVFVDGFEHEEKGAEVEDEAADEGGDAAAVEDLAWEAGGGVRVGEEAEEGVEDPD